MYAHVAPESDAKLERAVAVEVSELHVANSVVLVVARWKTQHTFPGVIEHVELRLCREEGDVVSFSLSIDGGTQ